MTFCGLKSQSKSDTEDRLARLDEVIRRSAVGDGFVERGHFFDAAASMWVAGELVHVEDLVLHDAQMDIRAPTHELTIGHTILRARRRIFGADPAWAVSEGGVAALTGAVLGAERQQEFALAGRAGEGSVDLDDDEDGVLAREFADIDAIISRSQRVLDALSDGSAPTSAARPSLAVGDLVIRDPDWDEAERLSQWRSVLKCAETLPPALAAVLLYDAWESLEPVQRQHWLGGQLVVAYLRSSGKIISHLLAYNVGLKAVPRERRRARERTTRLLAFLEAMSIAAEAGMKEIVRLNQARDQMERRMRGRRSSSSLPAVIDLILSRPIVSASMIAKAAGVTPRGALNLIGELGAREMTGRGRCRAWGVL
ncbi:hypothetical protein Agau_P200252 (plasmid) [Agrobacterium tumefaciens F2]|jgi:Protein of unknown function (DUF1612)/HTH DNA binding domain|nr:hypothetical protein Agau_P200252 [Agrobacterium tumefaciens F2]